MSSITLLLYTLLLIQTLCHHTYSVYSDILYSIHCEFMQTLYSYRHYVLILFVITLIMFEYEKVSRVKAVKSKQATKSYKNSE